MLSSNLSLLEIPKFICNLFSCRAVPFYDKSVDRQKIRCTSTTSRILFTVDPYSNYCIICTHSLCKTDLINSLSLLKQHLPPCLYILLFYNLIFIYFFFITKTKDITCVPNKIEKKSLIALQEAVESLQNELTILSEWIHKETKNKSSSKNISEKLFDAWQERSRFLLSQLESDKIVQELFHNSICEQCIEEIQSIKN